MKYYISATLLANFFFFFPSQPQPNPPAIQIPNSICRSCPSNKYFFINKKYSKKLKSTSNSTPSSELLEKIDNLENQLKLQQTIKEKSEEKAKAIKEEKTQMAKMVAKKKKKRKKNGFRISFFCYPKGGFCFILFYLLLLLLLFYYFSLQTSDQFTRN